MINNSEKLCQQCKSDRLLSVSGKTNDLFSWSSGNKSGSGYVIYEQNIGGGSYIKFTYCLECGQIQGKFPVIDPEGEESDE